MNNKYLQELAVSYIKDNQLELTEENKTKLYGILLTHRDDILKQTPYYEDLDGSYTKQQTYFYQVLDDELESITEVGDTILFAGMALLPAIYAMKPDMLHSIGIDIGAKIKRMIDSFLKIKETAFYKYIKKHYKEYAVAERILNDKYSLCSSKCGITANQISIGDFKKSMPIMNATHIPNDAKPEAVACLITCTLDYLTSVIAELHKTLNTCNQNFSDKSDDSPVNNISFDVNCSEIKDYLKEVTSDFEDIVKVIYKDNVKGKNTWMQILNDKIAAVSRNQSVAKYGPTDSEYKSLQILPADSNKPKFQSPNYKGNNNGNFKRN